MATSSSGKVNGEIKIGRKSCSRTRSRSRDLDSKHRNDDEYKERCYRDKLSQEHRPSSRRSSSPSLSSSLDNRQAAESRPRPGSSSII